MKLNHLSLNYKITILVYIFSARSNPKTLDVNCKLIKTLDNGIVLDLPKR